MQVRVKENKLQVNVGGALDLLKKYLTEGLCNRVFRERRTDERERVWALYPLMWFWVMVSAQGVPAMGEAVKQARQGWQGLVRKIRSSRQALSQRAQEFSWGFFMEVFHEVVQKVSKEAKPRYCQDLAQETRRKWPRVWVLDASKLDPISKRLKILRKVKDQVLPGMVLAVYELYPGILRRLKFDPDAARSEYKMAVEWLKEEEDPEVLKETLVIADRLYGTPGFLEELGQKGAWGLVRRNRSVKIRRRKLLSRVTLRGHGVTVQDWQVQVGEGTRSHPLRYIRLTGRRGTMEWFTNVLDAKRLTGWEAADLYLRRWQVERMFAALKCVLDLKSFLCAHPNGVAHQVYGAALVYVAMRMMQADIATELEIDPEWLSEAKLFPRFRQAFHDYLVATLTVERIKRMNPGTDLQVPDPKEMEFCWVDAHDVIVDKRAEGRGRPRRGKPNWKSIRHIKGGSTYLRN